MLPGSRSAEVEYIALPFFRAAALILKARPAIKLIVPAVPALRARIEQLAHASGLGDALQIVTGQSHTVLAACDVTLIASGTATLEAALFKRPMVIGYHMHPLSWWLMRRKQLQPWVGCPTSCAAILWCPSSFRTPPRRRRSARPRCWWLTPACTSVKKSPRLSNVSPPCTKACSATRPDWLPMRSAKVLAA
jgi:hypothetical protein